MKGDIMGEERMKILEMLESGKISAAEAEKLIAALEVSEQAEKPGKAPRWLRVRVFDKKRDKNKVNVNIPISLAKIALKFIPKDAKSKLDKEGLDVDAILQMVREGVSDGKIVEVDEEDERVFVTLE
jgi:hypothetical protein